MKVLTPFSMSSAIRGALISALAGAASVLTTACSPSESVTAFSTFALLVSAYERCGADMINVPVLSRNFSTPCACGNSAFATPQASFMASEYRRALGSAMLGVSGGVFSVRILVVASGP